MIIGGGVVGSCAAYHLAIAGAASDTVVVEPDPTYEWAATPRSTGGVRIQFSLPELIRMSLYGHEVYGSFATLMAVDGEPGVLDLRRRGYLYLGKGRGASERFEFTSGVQAAEGANIRLLSAQEVKSRWPSIETHDVDIASFSPDDAIVDPYAAVVGIRKKAISLGVEYIQDRVVNLERRGNRVSTVDLESGRKLDCEAVVNAANCWAPEVCAMVGMKVPVAPMRRMTFYFECRSEIEDLPLVRHISTGVTFRAEGAGYITGETRYGEPRGFNWEVDHSLFDDVIWPLLAVRVSAFEAVKMQRGWSCHYDQNRLGCESDHRHVAGRARELLHRLWTVGTRSAACAGDRPRAEGADPRWRLPDHRPRSLRLPAGARRHGDRRHERHVVTPWPNRFRFESR